LERQNYPAKTAPDEALDPIVDGIDEPPDDVGGRRERTGDDDPARTICECVRRGQAFEADGRLVPCDEVAIWRHLRHGSPRGEDPLSGPALSRRKKFAASRKSVCAKNIFTFVPFWRHSAYLCVTLPLT
jgi:hypothetical protein